MSLTIVPLNDNIPLGYGLDFRMDRSAYTEASSIQLYCESSNIGTNLSAVADEMDGLNYSFNSVPETMQISSTDDTDDQKIAIYYYPDSSASEPSTQMVDLSGNTPITLTDDIFRVHRMVVVSFAGNNNGAVYLSPNGDSVTNGLPTNIRCSMPPVRGFSAQSYFYVPNGWIGFTVQQSMLSNCGDNLQASLIGHRMPNALAPNLKYQVQKSPIAFSYYDIDINTAQLIPSGSTFNYQVQRTNGSNPVKLEMVFEYILFR